MSKSSFGIENLQFLVVDGDRHMRATLSGVIRQLGCRNVIDCETAADALHHLRTGQIDIMMTEWELPMLSGTELVKQIRQQEEKVDRKIPVIMISAHSKQFEVEQARDIGVTEFLVKPVNSNAVFARIAAAIERPRAFIVSESYTGPDRRRKHDAFKVGQARRELDGGVEEEAMDGGDVSDDEINAMLGL